jgi:uncharacterized protein with PIN domain
MLDEKIEERLRKWREAAKAFSNDIHAMVICPECNEGHLFIKDEIIEQWNKLDRYMICDSCRRWNVLTMHVDR